MKRIIFLLLSLLVTSGMEAQTPIAYYPFTGNASDAIGTNHGTVNGATLSSDRFGNANSAYAFDGINDVIELNHSFNGFTEFTISAWVKINGANQANDLQAILASDASGKFAHLQTFIGSSTNCAVYIDNNNAVLIDHPAPVINTWYQITLVAKSGESKMYLNGVEVDSETNVFSFISNTNLLRIGSGYQNGRFLNGSIDEVKIFNVGLSAAEVLADYNASNNGLIAYYPFTGNANDAVGINHGTVNGATLTTDRFGNANSAYSFDGVDDFIGIGNLNFATNDYTISYWVNVNANATDIAVVSGNDPAALNQTFILSGFSNGLGRFLHRNPSGSSGGVDLAGVQPFTLGQWRFVTSVKQGTTLTNYVNGVIDNTVTNPAATNISSAIFLELGRLMSSAFTPIYHLNGKIDEVKIYNTALSASQIAIEYNTTAPPTLIAHYPFTGNAGDSSGNANHGTVNGATLTTDRNGEANKAYSFNGASNYIEVADANSIDLSTNFTISTWLFPTGPGSLPQEGGIIINKEYSYEIVRFTNGTIQFALSSNGTGNDWNYVNTSIVAPLNTWTHITLVKTGSVVTVYKNGTSEFTDNSQPVSLAANTSNLRIGGRSFTPHFFDGKLDEVKIYNTALSASQIAAEYSNTAITLIAHYKLNNNAADSSGNNLHGAIIGSPSFTTDRNGNANGAIEFNNNVANRIEVDDNILLHTPSITIGAWVKFNSLGGIKTILDKPLGGNISDSWHFGTENSNFSCWHFNSTNTNPYSQAVSPINTNQWYYVVNTFDDVSKQHKLYIDGVLKNTVTFNSTIGYDNSKMYIGAAIENGGLNFPMDGVVDEVKIYGSAMTASQILDAYKNEVAATKPGSGDGISLDGSNDYVQLPSVLDGATQFTVDFWIKTTESRSSATYWQKPSILGNGNPGGPDGDFGISTSNGLIGVWHGFCCGDQSFETTKAINDNQWHHVACVNDGSNVVLFVDGILQAGSIPTGGGAIQNAARPWRLGMINSCCSGDTPHQGTLDEFRMWNIALSQAQIRDRMCKKITNTDVLYNNLSTYYNFEEKLGSTIFDGSANANTATLHNGASRVTSGAPIGNTSSHDYSSASASVNVIHPTRGDDITVTLASGAAQGLQVYHVHDEPNTRAGVSGLESNNAYFGAFVVGGSSPTFNTVYNYDGIPNIADENGLSLFSRNDNSVTAWTGELASLNNTANTLTKNAIVASQKEFILGANDPGNISADQNSCFALVPNPLTGTIAYNGASGVTYQWQDSTMGGTWQNISGATNASPLLLPLTSTPTYYRRVATLGSLTLSSNIVFLDIKSASSPSIIPTNQWNLYAYDGTSVDSINVTYKGSYTRNTLGINTITDYGSGSNPGTASGYTGCTLNAPGNTYSLYAKRQGFPTGNYALNIPQHDDEIKIFKDGVLLTSAGCCNNMGSQYFTLTTLDANSVIECRMTNSGGGPGHMVVDIFQQNLTGGTIGNNQSNCAAFTPSLLSSLQSAYGGSSTTITYQWQESNDNINFTNINGATSLTYQPSLVSADRYFRRRASNPNNEEAFSNVVFIDINGPAFYADIDGDGYGDPNNFIQACSQPIGYLTDNSDCDDNDTTQHPGQQWYIDLDNDGYCVRDYASTPLVQCSRPVGGKVLSELIGTPFPSDCNDNDATINPANQYMTVSGSPNFTNSLVFPLQGDPTTTFYFEATYFDVNNALPPPTFPRVLMDYENDGFVNGINDKAILMTEFDLNDQTTSDGKRYVASITGLQNGTNWNTAITWEFGNLCRRSIFQNAPDVFLLPDVQIFANDITFSNETPEILSPLTITAVVHNESDFTTQNVVVHLVNQADLSTTFPDITIPSIAPQSSVTVTWNITTPSFLGVCPMQVTVDYTNVIIEPNELDNTAVASFNNGNAPVSGGIIVEANVVPQVSYASANNTLHLNFNAQFFGNNLPPQLQVAGAPVSFQILETGTVFTGFTSANGNINIPFSAPLSPGEYHISGTVTSFPFVGDISPALCTFTLLAGCKPDYTVAMNVVPGLLVEGQTRTVNITVKNEGCVASTDSSQVTLSIPGAIPDNFTFDVPPLGVAATFSMPTPLNVQFPTAGAYNICAQVDVNLNVDEINEGNNQQCVSATAVGNAPDLVCTQGSSGGAPNCAPRQLFAAIKNNGGVASVPCTVQMRIKQGTNVVQTINTVIPAIQPTATYSYYEAFMPTVLGDYTCELECDFGNAIAELEEGNNVLTNTIGFTACAADLRPNGCHVSTSPNDYTAGSMTVSGSFTNQGVEATTSPVTIRFKFSDNTFHDVVYSNPVQINETVDITTTMPAVVNTNLTMNVEVDPLNTIAETNEGNNLLQFQEKVVAWDFFIQQSSNPCLPYFFGNKIFQTGKFDFLRTPIVNNALHTADTVEVNYKVTGPGLTGQLNLGTFEVYDVNKGCAACPSIASTVLAFQFGQEGTYEFTITVDPNNKYPESNEGNNVAVVQVIVKDDPDMLVLPEYINPSVLNPAIGQPITVNVSYANIAAANVSDQMKFKLYIDGVAVDSAQVNGLAQNANATVNFTTPWSSNLAGVHVIKAVIDSDNGITETDETNNEATRAITVGSSANLTFNSFQTLNLYPNLNDNIVFNLAVENEGDLATNAIVDLYYVTNTLDTVIFATQPISVVGNDTLTFNLPWQVLDNRTTLIAKIKNSSTLEYNYTDNTATLELGKLDLYLESIAACDPGALGKLKAHVVGGEPPYNYVWSNGSITQTITDVANLYTATVIDFTGQQAQAVDSIPVCIGGVVYVKCLLEGFYLGGGMMNAGLTNSGLDAPNIYADSVHIELRENTTGFPVSYTAKGILHTNGELHVSIPAAELGTNRWVVVKHRNSIETWCAAPVTVAHNMLVDFTPSSGNTYGNNMKEVEPGIWAVYSGDINQDFVIDAFDYILQDPDVISGAFGYLVTDLTGDGVVDAFDYIILDSNLISGVSAVTP